jgi:hypothetical protein
MALSDTLGTDFPATLVFDYPSVGALAQFLTQTVAARDHENERGALSVRSGTSDGLTAEHQQVRHLCSINTSACACVNCGYLLNFSLDWCLLHVPISSCRSMVGMLTPCWHCKQVDGHPIAMGVASWGSRLPSARPSDDNQERCLR